MHGNKNMGAKGCHLMVPAVYSQRGSMSRLASPFALLMSNAAMSMAIEINNEESANSLPGQILRQYTD